MSLSNYTAKRFSEVLLNGDWIAGTNFKDQLHNISWEEATKKIGSLNTIAVLTFHINYYIEGILQVLNGNTLEIKDKYSFNAPSISSQKDWDKLRNTLLVNAERFTSKIAHLSDNTLQQIFEQEKYGTYQRNLDAMIEHSYYHLGQIVIIKKMLATLK